MRFDLTCSIVLYNTDVNELQSTLDTLLQSDLNIKIYLIDNSQTDSLKFLTNHDKVEYIFNNKNLGYGAGHNVAISKSKDSSKYHLIINADIEFDPSILNIAYNYMEQNKDVGMLSPQIIGTNGEMQHFCRRLPTPFDLVIRRFLPDRIMGIFKNRLDRYLLLDKDYSKSMVVPNLPGCFMFVRMETLTKVGGFDGNFFMYVEDVDLTRRLHEISKTVYYPEIEIVHGLARGSYKISKLLLYHIKSAIYYFNKWGWFTDSKRDSINNKI